MKKFLKKDQGFTLVELIVVIAILGILAGVGTVGYSGYIKKANLAADNQLVSVINQAFSAACVENGVDAKKDITRATVAWNDDTVTGLDKVVVKNDQAPMALRTTLGVKAQKVVNAFDKYYKGNEGGKFKVYTSLSFIDGQFVGIDSSTGGLMDITGYRQDYTNAAAAYADSDNSYKGNEEALLNTVGTFATAFGDFLTDTNKAKLLEDANFVAFCEEYGFSTSDATQLSSAMIMYAAQEISDVSSSAIHSALVDSYNTETGKYDLNTIVSVMNGDAGTPADMALDGAVLAAVISGYANSEYGKADAVQDAYSSGLSTVTGATSLFKYMNDVIAAGRTEDDEGNVVDDSFAAYLNSQAATDIAAITGGLGTVYYGTSDLIAAKNNDATNGTDTFSTVLGQLLYGKWTGSEG